MCHTSADGTTEFDTTLSLARARRVHDELTARHGVPAGMLCACGHVQCASACALASAVQRRISASVI